MALAANDESKKLHIAMFPWLAFGHLLPYLDLATLLAQKGHKISFISTPTNLQRLPVTKIPPTLLPLINFVSITLPQIEHLPENVGSTTDLPHDLVPYLKKAFDDHRFQQQFVRFIETDTPDWVIYDFAHHWLPQIAAKHGVSRARFSIFNAWSTTSLTSPSIVADEICSEDLIITQPQQLTVPPKWVPFPTNVAYRLHEAKNLLRPVNQNVSGISDRSRSQKAILGCDVFLIRTCVEIEAEWIQLLQDIHGKPVVPVGLLPPLHVSLDSDANDTWREIGGWLDKQENNSVIYVALGTEVEPSQEDFTELAHGLELSGLPFFWVLRSETVELPDEFEKRVKGRGIVWRNWAPQVKILSHDSVGCFLTHCGWSSIIEGIRFSRVLLMLPYLGDQGLNARVFEEKKVGLEIPRNEEDGSFTRDSVAESIRLLVVDAEGGVYRENVKEMSLIFADEDLNSQYVDNLANYLLMHAHGSSTVESSG